MSRERSTSVDRSRRACACSEYLVRCATERPIRELKRTEPMMSQCAVSNRCRPRRSSPPGVERLEQRITLSVTIDLLYNHDSLGFFASHPQAMTVLQEAATMLGGQLGDSLAAIVPSGNNTWIASTFDPGNPNSQLQIANPTVPANTIIVYAGGWDFGGGDLGLGGPGGYSDVGSTDWLNLVQARGQTGALTSPATDFGPWGGSVTFDSTANWSFAGTGGNPGAGQFDFLTVALHELGHVLGIGTSPSWSTHVDTLNNTFTGPDAEASYGGPVPLDAGAGDGTPDSHWADGTLFDGQVTAMNPVVPAGSACRLFSSRSTGPDWTTSAGIPLRPDRAAVPAAAAVPEVAEAVGFLRRPPRPSPTIVGEHVLTTGRGKRTKLIGFLLNFSTALNASNAQNASNYSIVATIKKGHNLAARTIKFRPIYNAATHSVSLVLSVTQAFAQGGKITVVAAPPSGIDDVSGVFLDGDGNGLAGDNAVFNIRSKATAITR